MIVFVFLSMGMSFMFHCLHAVLTDWETKNKYRVRNTLGQDVYFAAEGKYHHLSCWLYYSVCTQFEFSVSSFL